MDRRDDRDYAYIAYTGGWCTERLISDLLLKQGEQTFRCTDQGYIIIIIINNNNKQQQQFQLSSRIGNDQCTSACELHDFQHLYDLHRWVFLMSIGGKCVYWSKFVCMLNI